MATLDKKFVPRGHGKSTLDCMPRPIKHPRINSLILEVEHARIMSEDTLVMIVGPTGVGKSTLAKIVEWRILEQHAVKMKEDTGFIPVISLSAPAPLRGDFDWMKFFNTILRKLDGDLDLPAIKFGFDPDNCMKVSRVYKNNLSANMEQAENGLRARGVKTLIIDEGGHFTNIPSRSIAKLADVLKDFAQRTGCQIVFMGCYDMLSLSGCSGQLTRRIKELHFERYQVNVIEDREAFEKILDAFEKSYNGYFDGLLKDNLSLLMTNSLGCVGTLAKIIWDFYKRSQSMGRVSKGALNASLLLDRQYLAMLSEICTGEAHYRSEPFEKFLERER